LLDKLRTVEDVLRQRSTRGQKSENTTSLCRTIIGQRLLDTDCFSRLMSISRSTSLLISFSCAESKSSTRTVIYLLASNSTTSRSSIPCSNPICRTKRMDYARFCLGVHDSRKHYSCHATTGDVYEESRPIHYAVCLDG
jgi:hypothetical protein